MKKAWFCLLCASTLVLSGVLSCDNGTKPAPPAKKITMRYPVGGEAFTAGQTATIRWSMDTTVVDKVDVYIYANNGRSKKLLNAAGSIMKPETSFVWNVGAEDVPIGYTTPVDSCYIVVAWYADGTVNDRTAKFSVAQ